jgi:hypothetical protein
MASRLKSLAVTKPQSRGSASFILLEFDDNRHKGHADEMREFFLLLGYEGFDHFFNHGKLGFEEWMFESTPGERNALLMP